jgi:hypothetical protein
MFHMSSTHVLHALIITTYRGLWIQTLRYPGVIELTAGLFPPSAIPVPSKEVFMRSMAPWETACPAAKHYETS